MGRPKLTAPTAAHRKMIEAYRDGATLREIARVLHCHLSWPREVIRRWAPELMRPKHVVPTRRNHQVGWKRAAKNT